MSNTYEEIVTLCNAKIPRDVIETREGGFGRKLDYLPGFYVIDHLNEVLGQGNWAFDSTVNLVHEGTYEKTKGSTKVGFESVHYSAKVRLVVTIGDRPTEFSDYGYGDGTDATNRGKAHELAIKEAVTDGLKRCARYLGNSFGNGLYDRSGEGIDEGEPGKGEPKTETQASVEVKVQPGSSREATNRLITQTSKVAIDKKLLTLEQAQEMVRGYGVKNKEELTDEQAVELLNGLRKLL